MIDKDFTEKWSTRYDEEASGRDKLLEEKISDSLKKLFPDDNVKYITREILYDIISWKAPRVREYVDYNMKEFVEAISKICFSSENEQVKLEVLTILKGVGYRSATAILFFCFPLEYTVMDFRAWWTLQEEGYLSKDYDIKDDFEHWQKYLKICKEISNRCGCTLRELDKALWQHSKENQKKNKSGRKKNKK